MQNHAHVLAFDLYYFSKKIGSTFSFFNSSALICSLILVSIEEIDQTFETAFSHIRKRVESRQKHTVTRHVVDCYHDCFAFLAVSLHFFFLRVFCFLLQSFRMLTLSSFLWSWEKWAACNYLSSVSWKYYSMPSIICWQSNTWNTPTQEGPYSCMRLRRISV